jgi:hypothetical protein
MSKTRKELPRLAASAVTVKKVVPQGLTHSAGILKNRRSEIRRHSVACFETNILDIVARANRRWQPTAGSVSNVVLTSTGQRFTETRVVGAFPRRSGLRRCRGSRIRMLVESEV